MCVQLKSIYIYITMVYCEICVGIVKERSKYNLGVWLCNGWEDMGR